ncbi:hypothetical protein ACFVWY_30275 [Streptomyces sp. NPDC058195]|uniref:hypothetical protein n=1 Tax=Streptomyces sp. NPDC058195 TaxID=3346375 RepID=UPI0036ECD4E8
MPSTAPRPVFRRLVGAVAVTLTLAATSGCTVPSDAVTGISVTDDGHVLGVIMVCGHHIDGATLYVDSDEVTEQVTAGRWTAGRPLTAGLTTWTLDPPPDGWTATGPLTPLAPRTTYTLYGWTTDDSWSASHVSFTLTDLDRLPPGKVRYDHVTGIGKESAATVTMAEFQARACEDT